MSNIFGVANPDKRPERRTYDLQQEVRSGRWQDNSSLWTHGYKYGDGHAGLRDHRFLPAQPPATEQRKTGWRAPVDDDTLRPSTKGAARLAPRKALAAADRTSALAPTTTARRKGCPMTAFEHHCFLSGAKRNEAWFLTSSKMEFASVPTGNRSVCH
jgi:hypothetical protein